MPLMRAPGGWSVETVTLDGVHWFRVKQHGSLALVGSGRRRGLVRTIGEVRDLLGDAYVALEEDRSQRFEGGR